MADFWSTYYQYSSKKHPIAGDGIWIPAPSIKLSQPSHNEISSRMKKIKLLSKPKHVNMPYKFVDEKLIKNKEFFVSPQPSRPENKNSSLQSTSSNTPNLNSNPKNSTLSLPKPSRAVTAPAMTSSNTDDVLSDMLAWKVNTHRSALIGSAGLRALRILRDSGVKGHEHHITEQEKMSINSIIKKNEKKHNKEALTSSGKKNVTSRVSSALMKRKPSIMRMDHEIPLLNVELNMNSDKEGLLSQSKPASASNYKNVPDVTLNSRPSSRERDGIFIENTPKFYQNHFDKIISFFKTPPDKRQLDDVKIIKKCLLCFPVFQKMKSEFILNELCMLFTLSEYPENTTVCIIFIFFIFLFENQSYIVQIFDQGDLGYYWYVILSGRINVLVSKGFELGSRKVVANLVAGNAFGSQALIHDTPRTGTTIAETQTILLTIHKSHYKRLTGFIHLIQQKELVNFFKRRVPLFHKFAMNQLMEVAGRMSIREFEQKMIIIRQGEQRDHVCEFFFLRFKLFPS
jgi:hypothetical protein